MKKISEKENRLKNGALVYKPWGFEQVLEINAKYIIKKIIINSGQRTSKHYHDTKMESIIILDASGRLELEEVIYSRHELREMPTTIILKEVHRLSCRKKGKFAEFLEVSTPELNDVVRLEDDYGRV